MWAKSTSALFTRLSKTFSLARARADLVNYPSHETTITLRILRRRVPWCGAVSANRPQNRRFGSLNPSERLG